jgi:chaperonin GroEL (HSP60 family)
MHLTCTQAAVEEGIVIGGGCTLLKLANKVDAIKAGLDNDEQKVSIRGIRGTCPFFLFWGEGGESSTPS